MTLCEDEASKSSRYSLNHPVAPYHGSRYVLYFGGLGEKTSLSFHILSPLPRHKVHHLTWGLFTGRDAIRFPSSEFRSDMVDPLPVNVKRELAAALVRARRSSDEEQVGLGPARFRTGARTGAFEFGVFIVTQTPTPDSLELPKMLNPQPLSWAVPLVQCSLF